MKKKFRVKAEKDFRAIFKQKLSKANRQFVLYYLHKEHQQHLRVGLSISKKLGNAVERNQIKRKIRRAFHELEGNFKPDYDIIIIARSDVKVMSVQEIKKSIVHVTKLANLYIKLED